MAQSSDRTFVEAFELKELGKNKWEGVYPPQKMGNSANIAYGGCTLAAAAQAASKSVPEGYFLYTMMGNFLGPALTDRPLIATTRSIRKTRTFATLQIEVSQKQDNGSERACLVALADFQVQEKATLLEFSASPKRKLAHYADLPSGYDSVQKLVDGGKVSQEMGNDFMTSFGLLGQTFDLRPCPEGIFAQNINGMAKSLPTTQDGLSITEKSTGDWIRCRTPLPTAIDNTTALTFFIDGAIAFTPLAFNHMFLDDAAACSSLDFALRVFSNDLKFEQWHLREIATHVGAEGRTYSEARVWDEQGRMVASMTQQSIMRPLPVKKGKL